MSVVQAEIIFYICNCIAQQCAEHIYRKCFRIVLSKKSDSFKKQRDDGQHSFLVQMVESVYVLYPHICSSVGYCIVYFAWALSEPLT